MTGVRICRYSRPDDAGIRVGILSGDDDGIVVDLAAAWAVGFDAATSAPASPLEAVVRRNDLLDGLRTIEERVVGGSDAPDAMIPRAEVRLELPLEPTSLRDVPAYRAHVLDGMKAIGMDKTEDDLSSLPAYYRGDPHTCIGPTDDVIAPTYADTLDFEAELAIVVGAEARDLDEEAAKHAIGGWVVFNDVSARTRQMEEMKSGIGPGKGKDFETGNVLGPAILIDPDLDLSALTFEVRVDDDVWASGPAGEIAWSPAHILCHLSESQYVRPGDVVGLGTFPTGCGLEQGRYPDFGSTVEIWISGIGRIANRFLAPGSASVS
ncbi:MAG: fumarylacetoacetate hydrolase family protein [Acidimicrobiales bacterium]